MLDRKPDIVMVNDLNTMCAVLRSGRKPPRMFFDLNDVQHLVRFRWCLQPPFYIGKLLQLLHVPALVAAEYRGSTRSCGTFVCSNKDRDHLVRLGFPKVKIIPNAVDVPAVPAPHTLAPTLLFIGSMGYAPNLEAAERMVSQIFPKILSLVPDARLILAGPGSDKLPSRSRAPKGVEYMGFVQDLDALYARSRIFVCPMVNGGGTRLKLIDAAGQGLPIVSSRVGAEGLDFSDGETILLRDGDAEFADACVMLLADDALCKRLGAAVRARMQALYDANQVAALIQTVVSKELAGA